MGYASHMLNDSKYIIWTDVRDARHLGITYSVCPVIRYAPRLDLESQLLKGGRHAHYELELIPGLLLLTSDSTAT